MKSAQIISYGYSELYKLLTQNDLARVARKARMDVEDVRQEARLLCWSMATGQSTYKEQKGTPKQYIMGCLWGLAEHEHFHAHQEATEATDYLMEALEDEGSNPLEKLLALEEIKAGRHMPDATQFTFNMTLEETLWFSGMSYAAISEFTGVGKTTAFKRISKKFQALKNLK
jgi:DNA-directed RNA polymerase specialized sigma24 family protein